MRMNTQIRSSATRGPVLRNAPSANRRNGAGQPDSRSTRGAGAGAASPGVAWGSTGADWTVAGAMRSNSTPMSGTTIPSDTALVAA